MHMRISAAALTFLALGPSNQAQAGGKPGKLAVAAAVTAVALTSPAGTTGLIALPPAPTPAPGGGSTAPLGGALALSDPQDSAKRLRYHLFKGDVQPMDTPARLGPDPVCLETVSPAHADLAAFNAVLKTEVEDLREQLAAVDPAAGEDALDGLQRFLELDPCPDNPHPRTDFHAHMDWEADQAIRLMEIRTLGRLSACRGAEGSPEARTTGQAQGLVHSVGRPHDLAGVRHQLEQNEYGYELARNIARLTGGEIARLLAQGGQSPRANELLQELNGLQHDMGLFLDRLQRLNLAQGGVLRRHGNLAAALHPASAGPARTGGSRAMAGVHRLPDEEPRRISR
jgi:hypothetical protein